MAGTAKSNQTASDSESYLASLWMEIIGIEQVLPDDRFLDLGGNSLTLNIVLKRIEKERAAKMPARIFFDPQTSSLSNLARTLDGLLARTPNLSMAAV
jgi:hypothetical protein